MCVNKNDMSTESDPAVFYVDPDGPESENEFNFIAEAFDHMWNAYTTFKLSIGEHELDEIKLVDVERLGQVNLVIESDCDPCTERAVIKLVTTHAKFPELTSLTLKNVVIDGSLALNNYCEDDLCKYCPYFISSDGVYYDDKGNEIGDINLYNVDDCKDKEEPLIVGEYPVKIENCLIKEYRQTQKGFIDILNSDLTLINTDFFNVRADTDEQKTAFIAVECDGVCKTNKVEIEGGSVSYSNNGYEYIVGMKQYKFLKVKELMSVAIKGCLLYTSPSPRDS